MRKKRTSKVKIEKNMIIDAFIASVLVQQGPALLNKYVFKSSQLSGYTLKIAGAALAYLTGMLLKKNDIANIGIALAGADVANGFLSPMLLGAPAIAPSGTSMGDFITLNPGGNGTGLGAYVGYPGVMGATNYRDKYKLAA